MEGGRRCAVSLSQFDLQQRSDLACQGKAQNFNLTSTTRRSSAKPSASNWRIVHDPADTIRHQHLIISPLLDREDVLKLNRPTSRNLREVYLCHRVILLCSYCCCISAPSFHESRLCFERVSGALLRIALTRPDGKTEIGNLPPTTTLARWRNTQALFALQHLKNWLSLSAGEVSNPAGKRVEIAATLENPA